MKISQGQNTVAASNNKVTQSSDKSKLLNEASKSTGNTTNKPAPKPKAGDMENFLNLLKGIQQQHIKDVQKNLEQHHGQIDGDLTSMSPDAKPYAAQACQAILDGKLDVARADLAKGLGAAKTPQDIKAFKDIAAAMGLPGDILDKYLMAAPDVKQAIEKVIRGEGDTSSAWHTIISAYPDLDTKAMAGKHHKEHQEKE